MYDIIIEDTTHQFEDQIKAIENVYNYLKPGGILIIEDIFKHYNENDYIDRLKPILHHFQDYFFVSLDHVNRNSTGWNNDKLFVLVKGEGESMFTKKNKITIITPSYRVDNLIKIKDSINFDYVDEWIIVYDGSKIKENPNLFINESNENNDKIKEYVFKCDGISGNPQRNYALTKITNPNTFLYYLDDDNEIHPDLYKLIDISDKERFYTFNQIFRKNNNVRLVGNNIKACSIDTAMILIDYSLCKNINWKKNDYAADFYYIEDCYKKNKDCHVFVNNNLSYYNCLR
jgi:hypothetical protein